MSDLFFIGVDNGSQSTKVMIFNQNGEVVASASEPLRPLVSSQPGYAEHPDDDLWDSIKAALKRAMREFGGDASRIAGLGLCTIRCCRVFMKADGTLAAPVMSWMDVRAYERFTDRDDIAYTCPTSGYITHRLTGQLRDTAANAFQWQFPVDMDTWQWSTDEAFFNGYNIPRDKLLSLQPPGTILGYVTKEAAESTGVPIGTPVVGTGSDKAVEALGSGITEPGSSLISLGTYVTSMVHARVNRPADNACYTNFSCIPKEYLYESGGIRRGMSHVSWLKSLLGNGLADMAAMEGSSVEDYLANDAVRIPPGADGLLTIPDWLAPASELFRKGVMLGFQERHTKAHIFRSILEGIAMTLKNHYDAMLSGLSMPPGDIIVSGGGSNSGLLMQIISDMYGVRTIRNKVNGAAALGSAICAATATGVYGDMREAAARMVRKHDEFYPDMVNHEIYKGINDRIYRDLPTLLRPALEGAYDAYRQPGPA